MVFNRDNELITDRMRAVLRRETIVATHFLAALIATMDILDESNDDLPLELKITSFIILALFMLFGVYRLRKLDQGLDRPALVIGIYAGLSVIVTLVLSDLNAPYLLLGIIPLFLSDFYYSRKLTNALLLLFLVTAMLQPITLAVLYSNLDDTVYITLRNYSVNFIQWLVLVTTTRIVTSTTAVTDEDRKRSRRLAAEAREREKYIEDLINEVDFGVLNIDVDGKVSFANDRARAILDANESLVNENFFKSVSLQNAREEELVLAELIPTMAKNPDIFVYKAYEDGTTATIDMSVSAIASSEGDIETFLIILKDVTNEDQANEDRKAYISLLSHELRTPVATLEAVLSNLQALLQQGKITPEDTVQSVDDAYVHLTNLSRVLNSVDAFTEVQDARDTYETKETDLHAMLFDVCHAIEEGHGELPPIKIHAENIEEYMVQSDPKLVRKLLHEIIENAVIFGEGNEVEAKLSATEDSLVITIIDHGMGIPAHIKPFIYKAGYQGQDYERRTYAGAGLGLYIAKTICTVLHIELTVESIEKEGTTVTLSIPRVTH